MPVKALIFGTDDMYPQLKPFYDMEVHRGNLEIIAHAVIENGKINMYTNRTGEGKTGYQIAIISSRNNFYDRMKFLESQGFPRRNIIDGTIFQIPNFNFKRFIAEGIAYGALENPFSDITFSIYTRIYAINKGSIIMKLGTKSYIAKAKIEKKGTVTVGNFTGIAGNIIFTMGLNNDHNYRNVGSYGLTHFDWHAPGEFYQPSDQCKILIGSDVWVGNNCIFKNNNPEKPLVIGDGAVIASDSVVVKSVPPYSIAGGNPARVIKYRFSDKIIESLLRIKWWEWDMDKIHDNFKYFNKVEKFVEIHDK